MTHWLPVVLLPRTHLRISSCSLPTEVLQSASMIGTAVAIFKPPARGRHLSAGKRAFCSSKTTESTSKPKDKHNYIVINNMIAVYELFTLYCGERSLSSHGLVGLSKQVDNHQGRIERRGHATHTNTEILVVPKIRLYTHADVTSYACGHSNKHNAKVSYGSYHIFLYCLDHGVVQ